MEVDAELGEVLQHDEAAIADKIAAVIERGMREQFVRKPPALRDQHPKAHGCVRAQFTVESRLPKHLEQGVFQPGSSYPAWIRFSNGNADVSRPDSAPDSRAMAIKLLSVPGQKLLPYEREALTQDFILVNTPVFFQADMAGYLTFVERLADPSPLVRASIPIALGLESSLVAFRMASSKIGNPLSERYWSSVPYQLGTKPKQAVKYSAIPHSPQMRIPEPAAPDYLRQSMIKRLDDGEAVFDFCVQLRSSEKLSVEDPRREWSETDAPFHKVATITIPKQDFANSVNDALADNLSFNPWHSLPEHRPLGAANRVRRVVYEVISELRRSLNGVPITEPV